MAPILTKEEQIAAFHELWDRRYQILNGKQEMITTAKVILNKWMHVELDCCMYDFSIYLVEPHTLRDSQDIIAIRRMDSGTLYLRLFGNVKRIEDLMDYAKENYPEFFEFIVLNTGCEF